MVVWTSPGDYVARRGRFNPSWWSDTSSQYGLLKTWRIDSLGCTLDGEPHSSVTVADLQQDALEYIPLRIGIPAGLQSSMFSISNVLIQSAINSFGSVVMAGSSAASGIENFIHTALNTFYQSAITFTGQSIVASDPRRAVRVFRINLALTTGLGIVLCTLAQIFQAPLLGLYVQSTAPAYDAVIAAGVVRVLALSRFQWVGGLMETACGTLRGLGHSMNPTVTTLIGACLLRVVWRYTVFEAVGTVESMYWSYPVSWLLTFLIHLIYLERDRRRLMAENTAAR